jgi:hypothetical protein
MLLSDSSMATGSAFFDMLPFDVIEIILTFLAMGNGCDGKLCLQSCLAFMFCCKRAESLMFQAKISVKEIVMLNNIFDIPSKELVNLLTRWGVEFVFGQNSIDKKNSRRCSETHLNLDVFPYLERLCFGYLTQYFGMVFDFTKFHMSEVITLRNSRFLRVIFDGYRIYNSIVFSNCTFGYGNEPVFVITISGGTFTEFSFDYVDYESFKSDNRGIDYGLKHLFIVNKGNTVATIKNIAFNGCLSLKKITLKGGVDLQCITTSGDGPIQPSIYINTSKNYI